jgi:hypothetical protein
MNLLRFHSPDGRDIAPHEWLLIWGALYPARYDSEHDDLISKDGSLSSADFVRIGRWKDNANTDRRWRPNVASVAYQIWMESSSELPVCPDESRVADFLQGWSERKYTDRFPGKTTEKKIGLSRASTLLYFISGGDFPIFDSRVREAVKYLLNSSAQNSARWYVESYYPLVLKLVEVCDAANVRAVEKALFSFRE